MKIKHVRAGQVCLGDLIAIPRKHQHPKYMMTCLNQSAEDCVRANFYHVDVVVNIEHGFGEFYLTLGALGEHKIYDALNVHLCCRLNDG